MKIERGTSQRNQGFKPRVDDGRFDKLADTRVIGQAERYVESSWMIYGLETIKSSVFLV